MIDMPAMRYTLREANALVSAVIGRHLGEDIWVEAEVMGLSVRNGHCYMELVQKDDGGNTPVASARATCWRSAWGAVGANFRRVTGQDPRAGINMLLKVRATFHERYGFSWNVTDIDPTFTLGDMVRRRMEIIGKLKAAGVFDMNRQLSLPMFCNRVAVVSSESAAGYGDFRDQLENNDRGLRFQARLFPSIMQGERVEASIIAALNRICEERDSFDCVVIIRGGGAGSDLSGFDTYDLAENVANFPLPVITGIGHERDECILDMVSFRREKTPTAVAAFLISHQARVLDNLDGLRERMAGSVKLAMRTERLRLDGLASRLPPMVGSLVTRNRSRLDSLSGRLGMATRARLDGELHRIGSLAQAMPHHLRRMVEGERHRLDMLSQRAKALDPVETLRRGYSITLSGGVAVRDASRLKPGDRLETRLERGTVRSVVEG